MKRILSLILFLALSIAVQAKPPEEQTVLLVGTTEQAKAEAAVMADKLLESGTAYQTVSMDTPQAHPQRDREHSYLLRRVGEEAVWSRALDNPEQAWSDFGSIPYDVPEGELFSWVRVLPSSEPPLRQYDLVEFYVGARPGSLLAATIGGQVVELKEERPGFYSGGYRVTSEDRVDAELRLLGVDAEGTERTRPLGSISLQGLERPQLTGLEQIDLSQWVLEGDAPPGSRVEIAVAIRVGSLFGAQTLRRSATAQADENGRFQAVARLGTLHSSPQGTVTVKAVDENGVEVLGPEQPVRFRSRVVVVRPAFNNPRWGYPGGLWGSPFYRRGYYRGRCR